MSMTIVGLTGGSGAGKSTAAKALTALGAGWVDADAEYHRLCREDKEMLAALRDAFGEVLAEDGSLDRRALAQIVFADPARQIPRLEAITGPRIREAAHRAFAREYENGHRVILYDAPTLLQAGQADLCNGGVIAVLAGRETRIARITARDGISEEAAAARIDAQPDDAFYRDRCAYILNNDRDEASLAADAAALWQTLTHTQNQTEGD